MNFFDLHCDTMLRLLDGSSLADADAHLNLSKAQSFEKWAQIFALFVLDNKPGRDTAYDAYRRLYAGFIRQMRLHADRIVFCRSAAELEAAWAAGKHAALLSVENGAVLGGRLERLDELRRDGVRLLTLTWMGENELGFGGEAGGPLTDFGRSVVRALPQYGIVPDISHLSDEGAAEVFRLTDGPVIATHSNARRITGHHRNLTEKQIREIVRRGGLIGINLCSSFLSDEKSRASCEDIYRHLDAILSCGAENTVCFGTDFDGAQIPCDIGDLRGIPMLYEHLLGRGLSEALLQKIFFENARQFWKRVF